MYVIVYEKVFDSLPHATVFHSRSKKIIEKL